MGRLFENMEKMDIQAERRKTAEALKELEREREKNEKSMRELVISARELGASKEYILNKLRSAYELSEEAAKEKIESYWKE